MLNAPRAWGAARVILDTDREAMIPSLIQEFGFAYSDADQENALATYGFYTTYAVEIFKMETGGRFSVKFGLDRKAEISYCNRIVRANIRYGLMDSYSEVREAVAQALSQLGQGCRNP